MDLHTEVALETIDRAVRRAAQATSSWHASLAREPAVAATRAPLGQHRGVSGKTAFDALGERKVVSQETAWRDALRRWVGALAVLRVTEDERAAEAAAAAEKTALVRLEEVEKTSFREAWLGLVRSKSASEASAWVSALGGRGPAVAAARRERAIREEEAVARLGCGTWEELVTGESPDALDEAARAFLAETRDLALSLRREADRRGGGDVQAETFAGMVVLSHARDAPEGWPARLSLRSLVATFGTPADIGKGLRVEATLPAAVGAASFARGLESFGVAYRRAAAGASSLPFALAIDPYFVDAYRFGFAFGALPTMVAYQRRGLGLGARLATQQARALSKTALLQARSVALSSLLARHAARPDAARFRELTHDVYGEGVPASLLGAFPRAHGDERARLEALLTTYAFLHDLRERYEEDWFRSPHAWRALRARASGPARQPEPEKVSPTTLARAFEEALG